MQSICLDIDPNVILDTKYYLLQNISEVKALNNLKNSDIGSWIFRFDYITQKYYLTIKYNKDEYINHHVLYYNRKTDEVIIKDKNYSTLKQYLLELRKIYNLDLEKQITI